VNVVAFAALLAVRRPEYEHLKRRDEVFSSTGTLEWSSADPMYLGGRPFYSAAHVADVPSLETLYFALNIPATFAALEVTYPLQRLVTELRAGSPRVSSSTESWLRASTFAAFGAAWAFAVGSIFGWLRGRARNAA
jgi:hypothetical protein